MPQRHPATKKAAAKPTPAVPVLKLGGLPIPPLTVATMLLLEQIKSPLLPGEEKQIGMKDLAAAAYILTDPQGAGAALAAGQEEFDRQTFAVAQKVPLADLNAIIAVMSGSVPKAEK